MDKTTFETIINTRKEVWNKFSNGWKKWDELTMDFCKPDTDEMINMLGLKDTDTVLDVAGGTGEPGLTIAQIVKKGRVVVIDQSEGMLSVAIEKIKMQGVKNFVIEIAEVSSLPFQDNIFDVISCRYGFMFFPDMSLAAKEMVRVLKPRGKLVTAVWDVPEKNFWVTAIMKEKIKTEVTGLVNNKYPQDNIAIDACSRVIYGEKED